MKTYESKRLDDAASRIIGVADGLALTETQGGFPSVQSVVILIWWMSRCQHGVKGSRGDLIIDRERSSRSR